MSYNVIFLLCYIGIVMCDINPKWEHPHAWGKLQKAKSQHDSLAQSSDVSEIGINENYCGNRVKYDVLETYYLKLVYYLVDKDRLKLDPHSGNLKRHIIVEMSTEELEQFAKIKNNVHAIDAKISEILAKNSNTLLENTIDNLWTVYERVEIFLSDMIPLKDLQFIVLIITFLLFVWKLSKVVKRNVIITFIGVIFLISYILDYLRCCQEKEIDALLELQNKSENPCQFKPAKGAFDFLFQRFGNAPQDQCKQHLMGNKKYFKEYCDLWEHFIDYLIYKHMLTFVQKMQHFVTTIISSTAFPYNIICVAIFLFFLKDLLIATITSVISNIRQSIVGVNVPQHHEPLQNNASIENRPLIINLKKKKYKIKDSKLAAITIKKENDSIEELSANEDTSSSDDCEVVEDIKAESIEVIT